MGVVKEKFRAMNPPFHIAVSAPGMDRVVRGLWVSMLKSKEYEIFSIGRIKKK